MDNSTSIKELYDDGKIVLFRAIYDVDFRPIFKIKNMLGFIADKMKINYDTTTITNDDAKKNVESIVCERSKFNMQSYISYSTFRVVQTYTTGPDTDFGPLEVEVGKLHERIVNMGEIAKPSKNKPTDNELELSRIGVRFMAAVKMDQEHIKNFNKKLLLSEAFVEEFCRENDKLYTFSMRIGPDTPDIKSEDSHRVIKIMGAPKLEIEGMDYNIELTGVAIIDFTEAYSIPAKLKFGYFTQSYSKFQSAILPMFSK